MTRTIEIESTRQIHTYIYIIYVHGGSIKKKIKKEIGSASHEREIDLSREVAKDGQSPRTGRDPRRVWRHQEGTDAPPFRRTNAIFHGCYRGGSLPEAGSGSANPRNACEREEEQSSGRTRVSRVFASKKARPYLTRDGERLMRFDESRRLSRCHV